MRVLEAHNGLSALVVENSTYTDPKGAIYEFDAIWISSLADSMIKGKPDTEAVDISSRLLTLHDILEITTKPVIFDGDTGGKTEHFVFTVRSLERLGVSAIIIEDKTGLKRNSLLKEQSSQVQEEIETFCEKIRAGKKSCLTKDFMIIARVESLILGKTVEDAIKRATAYIAAGADGIMIHSKSTDPSEIFDFAKQYSTLHNKVPLVAVPSTYNETTWLQLQENGFNMVIYANHLFRSAYPAMVSTANSILKFNRSFEIEKSLIPLIDVLNIIPGNNDPG